MIIEQEFKTRNEIETFYKKQFKIKALNNKEINLDFFIDKRIEYKKNKFSICIDHKKKNTGTLHNVLILENGLEIAAAKCKVFICNIITDEFYYAPISVLLKKGFHLPQKDFKSIYYKTKEYKDKISKTNIERYGNAVSLNNPEIRKKAEKTMYEKYGVKYFLERGEHYNNSIKKTMNERYDVDIPIQNKEIKQKISNTIEKRYGVPWFLCRGNHYEKIEKILIEKYGYKNSMFNEEIHAKAIFNKCNSEEFKARKEFFRNKRIQQKLINKKNRRQSVSKFEIKAILWILENFKFEEPMFYSIMDEKKQLLVKGRFISKKYYKVDFYDKKLNLVVEFQGDYWHANPSIYKPNDDLKFAVGIFKAKEIWEEDNKRKQEIINQLNCDYIEVWENDFIKNKNKIKEIFYEFFKNKKNN